MTAEQPTWDSDPMLPDLDFMGDPAELRERALEEVRAAGPDRLDGPFVGSDPTSSAAVTVDREGRVQEVRLAPGWRQRLDATALGGALFAAYEVARQAFLAAAISRELLEEQDGVDDSGGQSADVVRNEDAGEEGLDDDEWGDTLQARLERIDAMESSDPATRVRERRVASPDGYFFVRCSSGRITGVTGDAGQLGFADPDELGADAMAALREAELNIRAEEQVTWESE